MSNQCSACGNTFVIHPDERAFIRKLSPVIGGKQISIPDPTHCPDCRQQRRIAFRNDRHYYKNTCHFCKKNVVSIYSPDKNLPVLCHACFWSDQWDGATYGTQYDSSRPFFDQYADMRRNVPRLAIFNTQSDNSDYTVHSSKNRNCYMGSSLVDCEDVYYSDFVFGSKDCVDCLSCEKTELCYSCAFSEECYNGDWLTLCFNVTDAACCFDCKGCNRVLGCAGLRNASDRILNQPATSEEIRQTRARLLRDSAFRAEFLEKARRLHMSIPVPDAWGVASEECTGNYLFHCKNVIHGYNAKYFEDCMYAYEGHRNTDCCDIMRCASAELLYDCANIVELKMGAFCSLCYQCDNLLYCDNCHGCSNCFGCFGLKKKKFCILNKQYTKEEYETLVPTIVAAMENASEWGEFFPIRLSAFGYNESKAQTWYPLTEADARSRGFAWSIYEQKVPEGLKTINAEQLPEDIADVPDDILNYVVSCEASGKPFRLIPQELAFYRKKGLPVPRRAPLKRLEDLEALQNSRTLHDRTCGKCGKAIQTTYSPDRPEKVLCEGCYLKEVY